MFEGLPVEYKITTKAGCQVDFTILNSIGIKRDEYSEERIKEIVISRTLINELYPSINSVNLHPSKVKCLLDISLSHSYSTVFVARCLSDDISLGVDTESLNFNFISLQSHILDNLELELLENSLGCRNTCICLGFSAKEAFYKSYNKIYRDFLEFEDVVVTGVNPSHSMIQLKLRKNPKLVCDLNYAIDQNNVYSIAMLERKI